jgi:hypothetical protein
MKCLSFGSARWVMFAGLALVLLTQAGCVGLMSQVLYLIKGGDKIDAEFSGLQGKRVAIVCVSNATAAGPSSVTSLLERSVGLLLTTKGKKIHVVHQDEVANWIDSNDWKELDYREIGRGVQADMVLAIDLGNLSLHEGATLYKGRADVTVSVYDMDDDGKVVFRRNLPDFTFPKNGGRSTTEMSEAKFRTIFIEVLAQHVARYFYPYLIQEDFAKDAALLGI